MRNRMIRIELGAVTGVDTVRKAEEPQAGPREMPRQGPDKPLDSVPPADLLHEEQRDTVLRLQLFTPSSMLVWGQWEAKFFQQIYTQTTFFNNDGRAQPMGARSTYYSGIGNFVLGYSRRLNFGIDFWLQSVLIDDEKRSPFRILTFPSGDNSRTALTAAGPKIKWQPFHQLNGLTLQSTILIPLAKDPEGRRDVKPWLATQNFIWWSQAFYTHRLSNRFQLFSSLDLYWNVDRRLRILETGHFATPVSVYLSFFPRTKLTFFAMNQFWPVYGGNGIASYWYQAGLGGKIQFMPGLELEWLYGRFLFGKSTAGQASTFNLGLRFVRW